MSPALLISCCAVCAVQGIKRDGYHTPDGEAAALPTDEMYAHAEGKGLGMSMADLQEHGSPAPSDSCYRG
jgi:hypothetical protein